MKMILNFFLITGFLSARTSVLPHAVQSFFTEIMTVSNSQSLASYRLDYRFDISVNSSSTGDYWSYDLVGLLTPTYLEAQQLIGKKVYLAGWSTKKKALFDDTQIVHKIHKSDVKKCLNLKKETARRLLEVLGRWDRVKLYRVKKAYFFIRNPYLEGEDYYLKDCALGVRVKTPEGNYHLVLKEYQLKIGYF